MKLGEPLARSQDDLCFASLPVEPKLKTPGEHWPFRSSGLDSPSWIPNFRFPWPVKSSLACGMAFVFHRALACGIASVFQRALACGIASVFQRAVYFTGQPLFSVSAFCTSLPPAPPSVFCFQLSTFRFSTKRPSVQTTTSRTGFPWLQSKLPPGTRRRLAPIVQIRARIKLAPES
jgi:hypothetical protein